MRPLLVLAVVLAFAASARAQDTATPEQASALGTQAYLYGFPLTEFVRTRSTFTGVRCPDQRGNAPVNALSNVPVPANPFGRTVVAPNVDTLYSLAELDLGDGPVVLSHPDMGKRYFVFELMNPYTDVEGYIGTRTTGNRAGRFAITWSGHPGRHPKGTKTITVPYRRLWLVGRTLVRPGADLRRAHRLIGQYRLGTRHFAKHCRPGGVTKSPALTGAAFAAQLNTALADNPPPARDAPQLLELAKIGIGPGLDSTAVPADVQAARDAAITTIAKGLPDAARARVTATAIAAGGWTSPPANTGAFGVDYTTRAGVAALGFGANTPAEATYPTAYTDSRRRTLDGAHSYRITFAKGQLPPNRAFWSMTMYDQDGFLVKNAAERYAIGSTHRGLVRRKDGSVVVVVSHTRPAAKDVTWLPAPKRGPFRIGMRIYRPRASVLSGRWAPPPVKRTT